MEEHNASHPSLGLWGWLVIVGFGLVALARIISLLAHFDDIDGADRAPALFSVLGAILLSGALVGAGLFMRAISLGIRVALVLGGSFLLLNDHSGLLPLFSNLF